MHIWPLLSVLSLTATAQPLSLFTVSSGYESNLNQVPAALSQHASFSTSAAALYGHQWGLSSTSAISALTQFKGQHYWQLNALDWLQVDTIAAWDWQPALAFDRPWYRVEAGLGYRHLDSAQRRVGKGRLTFSRKQWLSTKILSTASYEYGFQWANNRVFTLSNHQLSGALVYQTDKKWQWQGQCMVSFGHIVATVLEPSSNQMSAKSHHVPGESMDTTYSDISLQDDTFSQAFNQNYQSYLLDAVSTRVQLGVLIPLSYRTHIRLQLNQNWSFSEMDMSYQKSQIEMTLGGRL